MALTAEEKKRYIELGGELNEDVSDVLPAPKPEPTVRDLSNLRASTRSPGIRGFGEAVGEEILAPLASGASKTATMGFGDDAAATVNALLDKGWNVKGADILKQWYAQKKAQEQLARTNPRLEMAGQVLGAAAVPAKGILGNAAQAGATALGEAPEPLPDPTRAIGPALAGGAIAGAVPLVGKAISGGARMATGAAEGEPIAQALRHSAGEHANKVLEVRAPMLKGLDSAERSEIGQTAIENKIIPWAMPNTRTMMGKVEALSESAGKQYGDFLDAIEGQPFDPRAVKASIENTPDLRKILTEPIGQTGAGRTQLENVLGQIEQSSPYETVSKTVMEPESYFYPQEREAVIPKTILRRSTPDIPASDPRYSGPPVVTDKVNPERSFPVFETREIKSLNPVTTTETVPRNMTMREAQGLKQDVGQMANFEAGPGVNRRPAQQAYGMIKSEMDKQAQAALEPDDFQKYMASKKTYGAAQNMQKGLEKADTRDATQVIEFGGLAEGVRRRTMENAYHPMMARTQAIMAKAAEVPSLQKAARALGAAAQRGTEALASTDYILQQTDPAYREFVEFTGMETPTEAQ